ncbi:MAG: hypothetical protein EOP85_22490, partial [Verrucomicrobiaceae bacterium]
LGPIAGGLLLASFGPAPVFAINALSFVAVIIVMSTGTYIATPRSAQREQMLGAMAAAIRYVRHAPAMRSVLARGGVHIFAAVAPVVLLPIIVHAREWNASDFGVMMGCYGAGAIFTAIFILPRLRARFTFDQVLFGASLTSALATVLVAFAPGKILCDAVLLLAGASWLSGLNTFSVASQSVFPNWVRARSSAIYLVVMQGCSALGAVAWGQLTSHSSSTVALVVAASGLVLSAILSRVLPISHVENLDLSPSNHWHGHALANEPSPDDGPILITIEYRIDPAEAVAFRAAMFHLREIRLRDGAFRCSVSWTWRMPPSIGKLSSSARGLSTCGSMNARRWTTCMWSRRSSRST